MAQRIRIFVTGGTFDKEYNELTGELFFKQTHVPAMLELGRCHAEVEIETLMMIDSLQMTDAGRRLILDRCLACSERRIVITHGTDTMENTAAVLGHGLGGGIAGKTVVLTGAMVPYQFGPHASPRAFGHGGNQSSVGMADPEHGLAVAIVWNGMCGDPRHDKRLRETLAAVYQDLELA